MCCGEPDISIKTNAEELSTISVVKPVGLEQTAEQEVKELETQDDVSIQSSYI